jgi:hypothetical protein
MSWREISRRMGLGRGTVHRAWARNPKTHSRVPKPRHVDFRSPPGNREPDRNPYKNPKLRAAFEEGREIGRAWIRARQRHQTRR